MAPLSDWPEIVENFFGDLAGGRNKTRQWSNFNTHRAVYLEGCRQEQSGLQPWQHNPGCAGRSAS